MKSDRSESSLNLRDVLLLSAPWALGLLVAVPLGNFPLNDDWSYAPAVHRFILGEGFRPTDWTAAALLTNVLWGALFAKLLGFSYSALRVSTLVMSLWGVVVTYLLVRYVGGTRHFAMGAAWLLALNPLFEPLSTNFMTDVPFMALAATAGYFYLKALIADGWGFWMAATTFAIADTLSRQVGIAIPFALVCATLFPGAKLGHFVRASLSLVATALALAGFQVWMRTHGRTPAFYNGQMINIWSLWSNPVIQGKILIFNLTCCVVYLGWMLSPILLASYGGAGRVARWASLCVAVISAAVVLRVHGVMPLTGNVITAWGIGPVILYGSLPISPMASIGARFWIPVTCLGIVAGGILGGYWMEASIAGTRRTSRGTSAELDALFSPLGTRFLAFASAAMLVPLAAAPWFFDRYLLPAIPFLLATMASGTARMGRPVTRARASVFFILLLPLATFAAAGTHDYFAWNRARWKGIDHLLSDPRVRPENISGGLEFDTPRDHGLLNFEHPSEMGSRPGGTLFCISLRALAGWKIIGRYPCRLYLVPTQRDIFVLERAAEANGKNGDLPRSASPGQ